MARALSFWINPATNDIEVDRDTGHVALCTGTDEVEQSVRRRLSLWQGEFFWDGRDGVPWQEFFGKQIDLNRLQLELLLELSRDKRLDKVLDLRVTGFDPQTRKVNVVFAASFGGEVVRGTLYQGVE